MVYFISSNTLWPGDFRKSAKLINPKQEKTHSDSFLFGDFFMTPEENIILYFDEPLQYSYSNLKLESVDVSKLKIGETYKESLVAMKKFCCDGTSYNDFSNGARNLYELYEYENGDFFWEDFNQLINLVLKDLNHYVDTFFINFSFFPNYLFTNDKDFFERLFKILDCYKSERFVIIIDPKKNDLRHLSCFDNLLEQYGKEFGKGIILEVKSNISKEQEDQNSVLYFTTKQVFIENEDMPELNSFIKRFENTDIEKLVKNRFFKCIKNVKADNSFWMKKKRLVEALSNLKNIDYELTSPEKIYSFMDRYLSDNTDRNKFLFCFQRINDSATKKAFDIKILNNYEIKKWQDLDAILLECRAEWEIVDNKRHNFSDYIAKNNIEEMINSNGYHITKYMCGKVFEKKGKNKIPECNDTMKNFILKVAVCTGMSYKELVECLSNYGFAFPRFSIKNLIVEFILKNHKDLSGTAKFLKYQELLLYMKV